MPESRAFGRRETPRAALPPPTPTLVRPARVAAPTPAPASTAALSPQAEAFRADLAATRGQAPTAIDDWRRSMLGRQVFTWTITFAIAALGVASIMVEWPPLISIGLGVTAFATNRWLLRERRQRIREIVAWEDPSED